MKFPRVLGVIGAWVLVVAGGLTVAFVASAPPATGVNAAASRPVAKAQATSFPGSTAITLQAATGYRPRAINGGTDDYHCTLVNPHVTRNSFIVSSEFYPESPEVHHAILFLVPPKEAAIARAADHGGHGWTCFGETAVPGKGLTSLSDIPWLTAWGPGAGRDLEPKGTGVPFPAGSLVVMQEHYNLLVGDKPVRSKLVLTTVPGTRKLEPLSLSVFVAPPDIPCPSGVHGPLCNRANSLADLGRRFGSSAVGFVNLIEQVCGRNPEDPPGGDTTSCTWPVGQYGDVVRVGAHMHLLGVGLKMVLDPGTSHQRVLLDVQHYDFHYQRSYNLQAPVYVTPSDRLQVTCTYNPVLRQELPLLRRLPPRYVTWGDGSADEMCLGLVFVTPAGANHLPGHPGWPASAG